MVHIFRRIERETWKHAEKNVMVSLSLPAGSRRDGLRGGVEGSGSSAVAIL
jgi:hypothetical protein